MTQQTEGEAWGALIGKELIEGMRTNPQETAAEWNRLILEEIERVTEMVELSKQLPDTLPPEPPRTPPVTEGG